MYAGLRDQEKKGFDGKCSKCGKNTDTVNLWFRCIDCSEVGDMMMLIQPVKQKPEPIGLATPDDSESSDHPF